MSALSTPITNQGFVIPLYSRNGYNLLVDVVLRLGEGVNHCYNWFLGVLYSSPVWGRMKPCECNELRIQDGDYLPPPNLPQVGGGATPTSHKGQGCHVVTGGGKVVGCVVTHRLNILPHQWGRLGGGYPFGFIPQLIKENLNCNNFQLISPHPALPIQGGDLAGGKLC